MSFLKRYRAMIALLAALAVFVAAILYLLRADDGAQRHPAATIAVVVYGDSEDRWSDMDQGIRQACLELGLEKPVLVLAAADDAERQMDLIQREIDGGAGGLLVAAVDSEALAPFLEDVNGTSLRVVTAESGAGEALAHVGADDAAMARQLADEVAAMGGKVAVLAENLQRQNVAARYDAFLARCDELGLEVQVLDGRAPQASVGQYVSSSIVLNEPDILVALDNDTLELAAAAAPAAMVEVKVCGIGASDNVVHALDTGDVYRLCYSNEYAVGYLAVMELAHQMGLVQAVPQSPIQYGVVGRQGLYSPEVERILFPITQ